jgi:hypothetical protein
MPDWTDLCVWMRPKGLYWYRCVLIDVQDITFHDYCSQIMRCETCREGAGMLVLAASKTFSTPSLFCHLHSWCCVFVRRSPLVHDGTLEWVVLWPSSDGVCQFGILSLPSRNCMIAVLLWKGWDEWWLGISETFWGGAQVEGVTTSETFFGEWWTSCGFLRACETLGRNGIKVNVVGESMKKLDGRIQSPTWN